MMRMTEIIPSEVYMKNQELACRRQDLRRGMTVVLKKLTNDPSLALSDNLVSLEKKHTELAWSP